MERYLRQREANPDFDQEKLGKARVLIVGVGGLGCISAQYLAAAGVGRLTLCDFDTVSLSNLNRQILYTDQDVGLSKIRIAIEKLRKVNPTIKITGIDNKFGTKMPTALLQQDLILDCLDNFQDRLNLMQFAVNNKIPMVHAAIHGFSGQFLFFEPDKSACIACALSDVTSPSGGSSPAIGPCAGVMGSMQALESIKYLLGLGSLYTNRLLFFDGLRGEFEEMTLRRDPDCFICSKGSAGII